MDTNPTNSGLKQTCDNKDLETYQSLIIYSLQEIMIHMILWYKIILLYQEVK